MKAGVRAKSFGFLPGGCAGLWTSSAHSKGKKWVSGDSWVQVAALKLHVDELPHPATCEIQFCLAVTQEKICSFPLDLICAPMVFWDFLHERYAIQK